MPAYSGKFQYLDENGAALLQGPCRLNYDAETCIVTPASGAPLAFDLGDIDHVTPGEYDLELTLYTGKSVQLRQFGATFTPMSTGLVAAWRDRTVRCLLLEDLEELMRCTGTAALGPQRPVPAEVRLYSTNLAVLPLAASPVQCRLADMDASFFEQSTYSVVLQSGAERLAIGKLGGKTEAFLGKLQNALDALRTRSAEALHNVFPFLNADLLQRLQTLMPEGRSVPLSALAAIHPEIPGALIERAVDQRLKPYFEALRTRAAADSLMAGFKFVTGEDEPAEAAGQEEVPPGEPDAEPEPEEGGEEQKEQLFFWFFFPMPERNMVAWEASTGTGRATYFFRVESPREMQAAVTRLTRGLALVNFRREPVYLPDESLERQPRYHRYSIGCRKLPDLRALRAAMLGRAIHSSLEKWTAQVRSITGA